MVGTFVRGLIIVGVTIFNIWTIIVAKNAKKEIEAEHQDRKRNR